MSYVSFFLVVRFGNELIARIFLLRIFHLTVLIPVSIVLYGCRLFVLVTCRYSFVGVSVCLSLRAEVSFRRALHFVSNVVPTQ